MWLWQATIVGATLWVAHANGANDNFKGVATLFGSGTADYRKALAWATLTTFAGSLASLFLATELVAVFRGNGLLPSHLHQSQPFVVAVIVGAASTVILATRLGIPVSTTHGLTGALVGSGLVAIGLDLGLRTLAVDFFLPLLISPAVALAMATMGYPLFSCALKSAGLVKENCLCVGAQPARAAVIGGNVAMNESVPGLRVIVERQAVCSEPGAIFWGIGAERLLELGHYLSAGAVGFARGLNDTPKMVALGLVAGAFGVGGSTLLVAAAMALGGLWSAKKVAETMGKRITAMEADQGFYANLVTSFLVIFASKWGIPVSTTHVSCGALFGIGLASGRARWEVIRTILLAWVLTLPTGAVLSAAIYVLARSF